MSRNPEYQFVSTEVGPILANLVSIFEHLTGRVVSPASPERIYIQWVANIIIQERVKLNFAGNQNLPSRAVGENLDFLGELFLGIERPGVMPAMSTQRFYITAAQNTSILIPIGTRVTDLSGTLMWESTEYAYIEIGNLYTDVPIRCQTPGVVGNDFALGQISRLVDVDNIPAAIFDRTENVTVSDGGADRADDDRYYQLMRLRQGISSTAGAMAAYVYFAMQVSTEIAHVVPNSPSAGQVNLYVLMNGGAIAGQEIKNAVFAACNPDDVRPLSDHVVMDDPEVVGYDIDFTYFINSRTPASVAAIEQNVREAVEDYIAWQCGRLGRDIVPDELHCRVKDAGARRLEIRSPVFTVLRDGRQPLDAPRLDPADMVPQIAAIQTVNIVPGGFEDE